MSAAVANDEASALRDEFRQLFEERDHKIAKDLLGRCDSAPVPQLRAMIKHLSGRPRKANWVKANEGEQVRILVEGTPFAEIAQHSAPPAARRTKKSVKAELEAKAAEWELRWDAMGTPEKIRDAQREARQQGADTHHGKVPDGRYAIPNLNGSTDLSFYLIETSAKGKWEGTTFVERIIGGHPNEPVRGSETKQLIYREIRKLGIEASQILAAREIKQCRDCGTDLTNPVSRMLSQGPTCGGRN